MLDRPASWVALVLMALHPWAVRYSTEARAYGMLMLAVALCFYFLQRAFDDGRWRWWLGLGLAEFLCVWSFSGVVFYLVVLNTGILTRMVYLWSKGGEGVMVLRPVVGMAVGGMVALQLMLPTLPQLIEAMNLDSLKGSMGRVWWADVMGGLLWGVRGWDSDPENPFNLALVRMLIHQPALWVVLVIEVALIIVGFVVLVKKSGVGRILAFAGPVGLLLSWLVMTTRGKYLHPWYVIYVIPNIIMFLVVGYKTITNINYLKNTFKWTMILIIFVIGGSWVWNDLLYVHRGKENLRGLVEVAHQFEFINGRKTGIYAAMLSDTDIYDSSVYVLKSTSEIDEVVIRARREEVPLLVSIGHQGIGDAASALQKLNKSEEFEMVATVWGLDEQQFTHYIYKLRSNK